VPWQRLPAGYRVLGAGTRVCAADACRSAVGSFGDEVLHLTSRSSFHRRVAYTLEAVYVRLYNMHISSVALDTVLLSPDLQADTGLSPSTSGLAPSIPSSVAIPCLTDSF
jgi:hypothetical protein